MHSVLNYTQIRSTILALYKLVCMYVCMYVRSAITVTYAIAQGRIQMLGKGEAVRRERSVILHMGRGRLSLSVDGATE